MIKTFQIDRSIFYFLHRIVFFVFITSIFINTSFAQNMPVPENIQAALLPKVLKYSPNFSQNTKIRMLIVFDNNSETSKNEFIKEFGRTMEIKAVYSNELEQNIANCDLVYFMPGLQNKATLCKKHQVLSVSGISQYVEQGEISLAFGIQNNKPKIFVNLSSFEKEGQSLSSDILRIAKVF